MKRPNRRAVGWSSPQKATTLLALIHRASCSKTIVEELIISVCPAMAESNSWIMLVSKGISSGWEDGERTEEMPNKEVWGSEVPQIWCWKTKHEGLRMAVVGMGRQKWLNILKMTSQSFNPPGHDKTEVHMMRLFQGHYDWKAQDRLSVPGHCIGKRKCTCSSPCTLDLETYNAQTKHTIMMIWYSSP